MTRPTFSQTVIDEAAAWAVRLGADDAVEADYLAFEDWLARAPEHPAAFAEAEALWAALDDDRAALDAALTRSAGPGVAKRPTRKPPARSWRLATGVIGAMAALIVAAVVLVPALTGRTDVYVTAPGEQRTVTLADGSIIAMNGGSTLSVRLTGRERLVEMGSAEAAFDVARDTARPFRVVVGESRVEVLGTAFDIRRDEAETRVSVSRGLVRVSDLDDPARNVRLGAGQSVSRSDAADVLEVTQGPVEVAGWRTGRLIYDDKPLSEVLVDLNRAYPTPIRATGGAERLRFTGVLVLEGQAATVRQLEAFLPVTASRKDDVIELRPR